MQLKKQIHMFVVRKMTQWHLTMTTTMINRNKRKTRHGILEKLARPRIKPVVHDLRADILPSYRKQMKEEKSKKLLHGSEWKQKIILRMVSRANRLSPAPILNNSKSRKKVN